MNFLLATNIPGFKEDFKKNFKNLKVYKYDLDSYKDVEEFLSKNKGYDYIITSEKLLHDIDLEQYLKIIRRLNSEINIIYLAEKISISEKNILFKYNVFNLIEDIKLNFNSLNDIINNNKNIVYQSNSNIVNSRIVSVFGTSGSGKSLVSYLLAKELSKHEKTLLLNVDIQNPCIDIYTCEKEKNKNILDILEQLELCKDKEYVKEYISKKSNVDCIYSNLSLYESQSKLNISKYEHLLNYANKNYIYSIFDLTNCIFIDQIKYFLINSSDIIFVVNPNYISIRQAIKYLEIINQLWKIPSSKIKIVLNKVSNRSLNKTLIKSLLPDYDIYGIIQYSSKVEEAINMGNDLCINADFRKLLNSFGISLKKEISFLKSMVNTVDK